jgi:hypothetical protein
MHVHPAESAPAFVAETTRLIDRVHGDGFLPDILVQSVASLPRRDAVYETDPRTNLPKRILVSRRAVEPHLSTAHEIGHVLDHLALGKRGEYASEADHPTLRAWRGAVEHTPTVLGLRQALHSGRVTVLVSRRETRLPIQQKRAAYLLEPAELFARSYAQYVAQHHPEHQIAAELKHSRAASGTLDNPLAEHWDVVEFESVAQALDDLFVRKLWMHAPERD